MALARMFYYAQINFVVTQEGVTYVHVDGRRSIGEKRNIAVHHAKGNVIVHWDDDDFFREHRITTQVQPHSTFPLP